MSDKMPDEIWANEPRYGEYFSPPDHKYQYESTLTKYVRADLPKEVDLKRLEKHVPFPAAINCEERVLNGYVIGFDDCLNLLVALGVIKDKASG